MVNLDGFGSFLNPLNIMFCTPNEESLARAAAKKAGFEIDVIDTPPAQADHRPFEEAGIPVLWPIDGPYHPYYHTEKDTPRFIDPDRVATICEVAGYAAAMFLDRR